MIEPMPTTAIDPSTARGLFIEHVPETATKPAYVRLGFPNTSYKLDLIPEGDVVGTPGKRIEGTVHAQAARIDSIGGGGRFVEPVFGTPRRVQGRVIAVNAETNEVIVSAGVPFHLHPTDPRQKATDFAEGQMITCGVKGGAVFRQAR
ncbi:MAG: hypothetical protein ACF8R9_15880 [Phycisphaerales bacterium JB054]